MLSKKIKLAKEAEYDATQKQKEWSIKAEAALKERVKQAVDLWVNNDQDRSKTFTFPLIPFQVEGHSIFELADVSTTLKRAADSACNTVYDPEYELKNKVCADIADLLAGTYTVEFTIVERAVRLVTDRQLTVERAARAEKYATELADIETKIKAGLDKWDHLPNGVGYPIRLFYELPLPVKEPTDMVHLVFDAAANVCQRENRRPNTHLLEYTISHDKVNYTIAVHYHPLPILKPSKWTWPMQMRICRDLQIPWEGVSDEELVRRIHAYIETNGDTEVWKAAEFHLSPDQKVSREQLVTLLEDDGYRLNWRKNQLKLEEGMKVHETLKPV
jgi:hypothetical protein